MVPDDPQGRNGLTLDNLLRKLPLLDDKPKTPPCPYGKKFLKILLGDNVCKYYSLN